MCDFIDDIKLCSCNGNTIKTKDNYWIIYRPVKAESNRFTTLIMGETGINPELWPQEYYTSPVVFNENLLIAKLNKNELLDFHFIPEEEDRLFISLIYPNQPKPYTYNFVYDLMSECWIVDEQLPPKKAERLLNQGTVILSFKNRSELN